MIYLKSQSGQHIVILEPGNLDAIRNGGLEKSPGSSVLIAFTPDASWLGEQIIANINSLSPARLQELITESQKRPEIKERPYHPVLHASTGETHES